MEEEKRGYLLGNLEQQGGGPGLLAGDCQFQGYVTCF